MKKSLTANLFAYDRIKTTLERAKEIRGDVDRVITWAKRGDVHSRRLAIAKLGDKNLVAEIFSKVEQGMFAGRPGGYSRILRVGTRRGDSATIVIMELVQEPVVKKADKDIDEKPVAGKGADKVADRAARKAARKGAVDEADEAEAADEVAADEVAADEAESDEQVEPEPADEAEPADEKDADAGDEAEPEPADGAELADEPESDEQADEPESAAADEATDEPATADEATDEQTEADE
jgi:large subunit ribosomal protein L17